MSRPKRLRPLLAAVLAAALLLCACGGGDESRSVIMAAPPSNNLDSLPAETAEGEAFASGAEADDAPLPDEAMALYTVTPALSGAYAGDENGCYVLATREDGSADIICFDYTTLTMTMLDGPQAPTDVFGGHVFNTWGGVTPMAAEGGLYLFRLGGSQALLDAHGENGQAAIMRLDADGTNPTTLTFPAGWTFPLSSAVLADEEHFYFLMEEAGDAGTAYILVQAQKDAGGYTELHRFADGLEYTIEGFWEKGPLLCAASALPPTDDAGFNEAWNGRQFALQTVGMNTGEAKEVFRWSQGEVTSVQGEYIYHWDDEVGALLARNANTGEEAIVAQGFAPDGYVQVQIMRTMLDGKLRLQFSTNRYLRNYIVDPATGEAREVSTDNLGENVTACAEGAEGFLVLTGTRWVNKDKVPHSFVPGMENSSYSPGYYAMPEYALIAKADYWAGTRSFREVKDNVYP